jgi:hypothetical protein
MEHLADIDTPGNELVSRSLHVGDDQVQTLGAPGAADVSFVPNWIEQPDREA